MDACWYDCFTENWIVKMGYRKVINRMAKAQNRSGLKIMELQVVMKEFSIKGDTESHDIVVEAYNIHLFAWAKLRRYIEQLKK